MNRIFGTSAAKKPKPTLQDAINSVRRASRRREQHHSPRGDPDRRADSLNRGQRQETRWRIDAVQGADEQAPERTRQGDVPLRNSCHRGSFSGLTSTPPCTESDRTTCPPRTPTKEDVRRPACPTIATVLQHGVSRDHHGEPEEHDGDRRSDEARQQGDEEAVR